MITSFIFVGGESTVISQSNSGVFALYVIDETSAYIQPIDSETATEMAPIPLPVPVGSRMTTIAFLSPDGDWLLYGVLIPNIDNTMTQSLQLYNLVTSEARTISLPNNSDIVEEEGIQWSPNSQYISLGIIRGFESYAYVYSLSSDTLHFVTDSNDRVQRMAWNNASTEIIGAVTGPFEDSLEIYSVPAYTTLSTYLLQTFPYRLIVSCNLRWSPNDTYIAFGAGCITDGPGGIGASPAAVQELHILDLSQGSVERITDYTVTASQQGTDYFHVEFTPYWIDNQTLLAGVVHYRWLTVENEETILHRLDTGATSVIRSEHVRNWVRNPVYPVIAFEAASNYSFQVRDPVTTSTQIGSFNQSTQTLDTIHTFNGGCDPSWSSDGETLAIVEREDTSKCRFNTTGVNFADRATGLLQAYTVPQAVVNSSTVRPLGWIQIGATGTEPNANAGPDQTVADIDNSGSESVTLDGLASTDSDGTIVNYSWSEGGIEIATGANPTIDLAVGTHIITLTDELA